MVSRRRLSRKRDLRAACEWCPGTSRKEACRDGACDNCGFRKFWRPLRDEVVEDERVEVPGRKTRIVSRLRDALSPEVHKLWSTRVAWSAHKSERDDVDVPESAGRSSRAGDDDDDADYEFDDGAAAGSVGGRKRTDLRMYSAQLWEFLDHFEFTFVKYAQHHETLEKQKREHLQLDRTYRPGTLVGDIDFAENYDIIHGREIQSQHWSHKQLTLFISIVSYLVRADFEAKVGKIPKGEKVTVETMGEENSYYQRRNQKPRASKLESSCKARGHSAHFDLHFLVCIHNTSFLRPSGVLRATGARRSRSTHSRMRRERRLRPTARTCAGGTRSA